MRIIANLAGTPPLDAVHGTPAVEEKVVKVVDNLGGRNSSVELLVLTILRPQVRIPSTASMFFKFEGIIFVIGF